MKFMWPRIRYEVYARYITESVEKRLGSFDDPEDANKLAARKRGLKVHFWDGPRPLYRDVEVRPRYFS